MSYVGVSGCQAFPWLLAFVLLVFHAPSDMFANYCGSKPTLSVMFAAGHKVYFGKPNQLFTFDLNNLKHEASNSHTVFGLAGVQMGVHFDPVDECENTKSNAEFCQHAAVYDDLVVVVSDGKMRMLELKNSKFVEHSHSHEFAQPGAVLPSVKSRLYAALVGLFSQVARSRNPVFRGATYDHFSDRLYMAATIDDSVAKLPEWGAGKYVLFRANFAPNGLLQDAVVVTTFNQSIAGLFDYNGDIFALTADNSIVQLNGNSLQVQQTFKPEQFFNCDQAKSSPISKPAKKPNFEYRAKSSVAIGSIGQLLFPRMPSEAKFVDSSLLTGKTFILIVSALSVLLVVVVAVDVYIVYSMNKSGEDDDELEDKTTPQSRKSASSKRSKSKSKSSKKSSSGKV